MIFVCLSFGLCFGLLVWAGCCRSVIGYFLFGFGMVSILFWAWLLGWFGLVVFCCEVCFGFCFIVLFGLCLTSGALRLLICWFDFAFGFVFSFRCDCLGLAVGILSVCINWYCLPFVVGFYVNDLGCCFAGCFCCEDMCVGYCVSCLLCLCLLECLCLLVGCGLVLMVVIPNSIVITV